MHALMLLAAVVAAEPARPAAAPPGFEHKTADVNGVKLHYVAGGAGEPLVLLHGWPQTWYVWRHVMPELAKHYTVIVPDLRGLGGSGRPEKGYDKKTVAEDVFQLVTKLGHKKVRVVGHDIGGMVAYTYAAQHPDAVERLVIAEVLLPGFGLEEKMNPAAGGYWHFGFHMTKDVPEMLTEGKERKYLSMMAFRGPFGTKAVTEADIDEYARCYASPGGMKAGFDHYRTLLDDGKQNRAWVKANGKLKTPTLVLTGERGIPHALLLDGVKLAAEDVRGVVVKDSGHWLAEEQPKALTAELLKFLSPDTKK